MEIYLWGVFKIAAILLVERCHSPIGCRIRNFENVSKPLDEKENQNLADFLNKVRSHIDTLLSLVGNIAI